jgi:formylglycine-generating enzyme required for sulfatase activity
VCGTALEPVGSHPESASPYGAQDMIGNAWEWVEDTHRDRSVFGTQASEHEVIKGGGYSYNAYQSRASYNGFEGLGGTCNDVGFRCAKDATRR